MQASSDNAGLKFQIRDPTVLYFSPSRVQGLTLKYIETIRNELVASNV